MKYKEIKEIAKKSGLNIIKVPAYNGWQYKLADDRGLIYNIEKI